MRERKTLHLKCLEVNGPTLCFGQLDHLLKYLDVRNLLTRIIKYI
jgi:hypothetical protein